MMLGKISCVFSLDKKKQNREADFTRGFVFSKDILISELQPEV